MPRTARASVGGLCYHVINRGNGRATVFHDAEAYADFLALIDRAAARLPMRVLAFCLMPNHVHLVLWPRRDGDLSRWMQWLLTAHVRRHHRRRGTDGHVWQGRFKAFPIQQDAHLLTVMRYVERNPVRAKLAPRAADWPWSSAPQRGRRGQPDWLAAPPVPLPAGWPRFVDAAQTPAELDLLRRAVTRGTPYGAPAWVARTAARLGLMSTIRPRGRPPKRPPAGKAAGKMADG
jgi:putative transposase